MPRCSLSSWSFGTSALREQSCRQFTRAAPRPLMGRFVQQSLIDNKTQEARDQERHLILNTELLAEYQEFWKTTGALAASPTPELAAKAHRHDENIKALQAELRSADAGRKPPNAPLRVVVRAERQAGPRGGAGAATYWNPYNRATNDRSPNISSTTPRRDAP
ncbi:hypothetical protein, partial [Massilia oculi]|uniref:hypothetical protein n=1 Tax=Massilia oculi TaxID=945844 RepID=UPI001AAF9154